MSEQTELLFKMQLRWADPNDFATCCEFYLRAKAIVVTSKLKGQTVVINSQLKMRDCFGEGSNDMHVSRVLLFEHKE
jgi:hypothetical protein